MTDTVTVDIDPRANTSREMARTAATAALRVANRNYELYDTGDVAGVDEVFAVDLVDHNPVPGAASAIEGMRYLIAEVRDGFTDTEHRILFQAELPDGWVINHWQMTARHTGDAFGVSATGKPVAFNGTDIVRVVGGRITEIYHVEELLQMTRQLTTA
ncbi:ester cyclase [Nocardia sp. CDC159]|uniref:Ester cyclase n=1 Tax=Nocardia pulmonis TaxID=2951408 RepID=A0A9X2ITK4_9NOCA|nr:MULTISPECIES: ester cyclase [Nocardia]MCM6771907.1 ester cyclase [Nocardia pulmonis]MCM6785435.1 ester cyclase [Nocardia sp. CDC159]